MIDLIKDKINQELPGIKAHLEMVPDGRRLQPDLTKTEPKKSAVLALLHQHGQELDLLFIKRTNRGRHGGQIAFPGGKVEPEDRSLLDTALRETQEEVGISNELIVPLGALTEIYIPVSNYSVQPYLGFYDGNSKPSLVNEKTEVEKSFWAPVRQIHQYKQVQKTTIVTTSGMKLKNVPYFDMNSHVVWGATALILNEIRHLTTSL